MDLINFTDTQQTKKAYVEASCQNKSVIYDGSRYMLKFASAHRKDGTNRRSNSCFSEYLGSQIFQSIGIPTQRTLLGFFRENGKERSVVACSDFTSPGITLQNFASLKNQILDSTQSKGMKLPSIQHVLQEQRAVPTELLKERFWDMFIVDALIGNGNRNDANWGFLYNAETDEASLSPIYACSNSLFPQMEEQEMVQVLSDETELDRLVYNSPASIFQIGDKRINYFNFISSGLSPDCTQALIQITPRIDMEQIREIIWEMPLVSELQKCFYWAILAERKRKILDFSLEKLR